MNVLNRVGPAVILTIAALFFIWLALYPWGICR